MAKGYLCIALLLLFFLASVYPQEDTGSEDELGLDDLDQFFEGIEEGEEEYPDTPIDTEEVEVTDEPEFVEEKEAKPKMYYPPPEPVPEFNSDFEKYMYYGRKYLPEICLVIIGIVYILNIFVGKNVNSKFAIAWLNKCLPMLKENFSHLGFGNEPNANLSQISYSEFEYYATGRDNCQYLFMNLRTKKRQDVIGGGILGMIWPESDRLIMDIPIDAELPLELLICRKFNIRKTQQEMPNINQLIKPVKVERFDQTNIGVLAESLETVDLVISKKFSNAFVKFEKFLEFLHITDQQVYTKNPLVLKAEILLGDPSEFEQSVKLVEVLLELVDHIATNVKLPARVLDLAKKNRAAEEKKKQQVVGLWRRP